MSNDLYNALVVTIMEIDDVDTCVRNVGFLLNNSDPECKPLICALLRILGGAFQIEITATRQTHQAVADRIAAVVAPAIWRKPPRLENKIEQARTVKWSLVDIKERRNVPFVVIALIVQRGLSSKGPGRAALSPCCAALARMVCAPACTRALHGRPPVVTCCFVALLVPPQGRPCCMPSSTSCSPCART